MLKTYDPKEVQVLVAGIQIGGWADGTFISAMRSDDAFTKVTGADGHTSRAKSNNRCGEITLTLAQTSPSNVHLSGIAYADELASNGVVPITIREVNATTVLLSAHGWVRKLPDVTYSKEIENREWVFDCSDLDIIAGGNSDTDANPSSTFTLPSL